MSPALKSPCCEAILNRTLAILFCTVLFCSLGFGQSNEIGVLAGGIFTSDQTPSAGVGTCTITNPFCGQTVHTPTRISYEGVVAHRVFNAHLAALHVEVPIVGTPTRTLEQGGFRQNFSTIFFTPGLRLSAALPFLSPFVSAGGGFAHYSLSGTGSTVAAFQVGGGVDLRTPIPFLGFRAEAREFHTGTPNFTVGQNNVFAGAGLVLKF
jgi:hypothetical protein